MLILKHLHVRKKVNRDKRDNKKGDVRIAPMLVVSLSVSCQHFFVFCKSYMRTCVQTLRNLRRESDRYVESAFYIISNYVGEGDLSEGLKHFHARIMRDETAPR